MQRFQGDFSAREVELLDFIVSTLAAGGSPAFARQTPDFAGLRRRIRALRVQIAKARAPAGCKLD